LLNCKFKAVDRWAQTIEAGKAFHTLPVLKVKKCSLELMLAALYTTLNGCPRVVDSESFIQFFKQVGVSQVIENVEK